LLARLTVASGCTLHVAKVDLDNFYHRLRLPDWLRPWFALPRVRASDVGVADVFGDTFIYPCCTTLPMGWSHSVYLAQQAHLHFIATSTTLRPTDQIIATNDSAADRLRHQVYIDDLILVCPDSAVVAAAQDEYIAAAGRRGLVVKMSKVVRPTTRAECLGLEVDGVLHTIGVSPAKLDDLCRHTVALVRRGYATGRELAQLVGSWTWACLARRPVLSVFSAVYRYIECAGYRLFQLWPSVRRELLVLCGLSPLLHSSLSSPWFPDVVATDASSIALGVVAARTDCASTAAAADAADPIGALPRALWRTIVSSEWSIAEHINVLELRAVGTAVRWMASRPVSSGRRVLLLSDSQVVVGAVSKGRSSSRDLLVCLRVLCAWLLATGLQLVVRWVASADNPADEPSRNVRRRD
jgi:hypothetical protein